MFSLKNKDNLVVAVEADTSGFDAAMSRITASSKNFGSVFSNSLSQAIIKGKSFEDTIRSIAMRLSQMALNSAFKPLENIFSQFMESVLSGSNAIPKFAQGGAFGPQGLVPFAKGGVVASPSYFNFSGGTGLMGEAGAEAILPLSRGADGKLGVAAAASGNSGVNIVFNVNATDVGSFRRSQTQITAMLARAVMRGNRAL
ncbi:MAG: phage tail tape measure protein [Rhizobiaceae bacterium]|nr:phage tail tape measure protein [Rhizobiaceae bacterium]